MASFSDQANEYFNSFYLWCISTIVIKHRHFGQKSFLRPVACDLRFVGSRQLSYSFMSMGELELVMLVKYQLLNVISIQSSNYSMCHHLIT